MLLSLIVLCRIVANPLSNVFQKVLTRRSANPLFVILVTHTLLTFVCLPIAFLLSPHLSQAFWLNMLAVAILTVAGNALLVQAVKLTDLSVLGPINAYKSIVSLLPGMLLLHEYPGPLGLAGMGLIVAGTYFIVDKFPTDPSANLAVRFLTDRGVQYRLAAMALSATEAVFLKRALLASTPLLTFTYWALLGLAAAAISVPLLLRRSLPRQLRLARTTLPLYLCLATTTGLMQLCTILTFAGFQVGYALALFQTSTLLTVLLGHKLFNERHPLERLTGSLIMIAGALLIVLTR